MPDADPEVWETEQLPLRREKQVQTRARREWSVRSQRF